MIIKYNIKKYFFYDNELFQTDSKGNFVFENSDLKTETEVRNFLKSHECYVRESVVMPLGNSGRLAAPAKMIGKRVLYIIAKLDEE